MRTGVATVPVVVVAAAAAAANVVVAFTPLSGAAQHASVSRILTTGPSTTRSALVVVSRKRDWQWLAMSSSSSSATAATDNSQALRNIEKKMEEYERQRDVALEKASVATEQLQALEQTKQKYLEGMQAGDITPEGGNFSETTARSAVKALMWRVIAGAVTFTTSLRVSKSLTTALSIVGSDFFSKALTMFIGERLMNKSQAGRKSGSDDVGRSLAKALLWRVFAICNTLTMSFLIAGNLSVASKIAGFDAVIKTALMFAYERAWAKVQWGKEYLIEFAI